MKKNTFLTRSSGFLHEEMLEKKEMEEKKKKGGGGTIEEKKKKKLRGTLEEGGNGTGGLLVPKEQWGALVRHISTSSLCRNNL